MKLARRAALALLVPTALLWPGAAPAGAADGWALQKTCPANTHMVIKYTVKANKNGGLWVGRTMSWMVDNNVQVSWKTSKARKMSYNTGMNGHLYWGHGTGAWKGSIADSSSYAICSPGV